MGRLFTLLLLVAAGVWLWRRFGLGGGSASSGSGGGGGVFVRAHVAKVAFVEGRVDDVDGQLPRNVLHAFADIASMNRLTGEVRVLGGNQLRFTATIPEGAQQQLRNAYFAASTVH